MTRSGVYGKLPAVGDFVSRGFSAGLCDRLDALIQGALDAAMGPTGDLRELMMRAPPVMIAFRPGALGATGFYGLWFPSQDRVGRAFPLCIGHELPEAGSAALPWPSQNLSLQLLRVALAATQNGQGVDELMAQLPDANQWEDLASQEQPFSDSSEETVPDVSFGATLFALQGPEQCMAVSSRALGGRLPWMSQVIGTVINADAAVEWFFGSRSMAAHSQFAALFDGLWEQWSWSVAPCEQAVKSNNPTP